VLASDGSSEAEVVSTLGVNESPLWTPDGGHIVFSSDRSGTSGLWSIPVREGKATGPASLVRADIGNVFPIGFTRSGTYYYRHEQRSEDVFVADLKSREGAIQ
jgi:Tol biopolymer transport system component